MSSRSRFLVALASAVAWWAAAPAGAAVPASAPAARASAPASFYGTPFERRASARELTELGRALFSDRMLSASGRLSCASCHDPAHAYGPPNTRAVQLGGASGREPGLRAVPSLMYRQTTPSFTEHFYDNDGNDSEDQGPSGGFDWDGRAASAHEQAEAPLLSPFEMGNTDRAALVARLAAAPSAARMRAAFGPHVFDDPRHAWNGVVLALEVFQQSPKDFYPFASKYDRVLRGQASLDPAEARGLAAFNDEARGNCAVCHPSGVKRGAFPQFTDLGFIALGVPRNPAIPANRDPRFVDLGLCGPLRTDLKDHPEYCGLFKTPSLRNVATRGVFFHNGGMTSLEQAVRFYAERDTHPGRFRAHGTRRTDDLAATYQGNLNQDPPFGRKPGDRPALTDAEIRDVVAFLKTLTDDRFANR